MKEDIRHIRRVLRALVDPDNSALRQRNLTVCAAVRDYATVLASTSWIAPSALLGTLNELVVEASRFYRGVFAGHPLGAPYTPAYWVPGPPGMTPADACITLPRWEGVYGDNRRRCVRALLAYTDEL